MVVKLFIQNDCYKYIMEKFALLLLLKESSPAVLSSSSMWVHSINKDLKTHREYVIYIYWNMLSYFLEYGIIFIGVWHHISLEYVIIFIGKCYHIYYNMSPYFIRICYHIYSNMPSYLLDYVIIFIGICHHIYWNMSSYLFIVNKQQ